MKKSLLLSLALLLLCTLPATARRDDAPVRTIRDDETEEYLHRITDPIFRAAGLAPSNVRLILVNDKDLNAYVAGGQNIFIHTGLITESNDPNMLLGVLAHETGHIRGGHLVRKREDMENAATEAIIGYALGLGSMLAGAPAGAAGAAISGGQTIAQSDYLRYSRGHEEAADQAALELLHKADISPRGLMSLLEGLGTKQTLAHGAGAINPYMQSHPVFPERISHIRNYLATTPSADFPTPADMKAEQERIVAKLEGFMDDPKAVLKKYPSSDASVSARYARAIALYRMPKLQEALAEVDSLIADYPSDPWFPELKGQMLYENGKPAAAAAAYERAVALKPDAPMIRLGLANALLAMENKSSYNKAIPHLQRLLVKEPRNSFGWRQLGIAYGKLGELGMSYLALAEEAYAQSRKKDALSYLDLADKKLPAGSPGIIKARELRDTIELGKKKNTSWY